MEINNKQQVLLLIAELEQNQKILNSMFESLSENEVHYKSNETSWNILEVLCHLVDEEQLDFRTRVKILLKDDEPIFPAINPVLWVTEKKYAQQDFKEKQTEWNQERNNSIAWLETQKSANWERSLIHDHFGSLSAMFFLSNWVAHDILHIRQILKIKYFYWQNKTNVSFDYAGGI